MSESQTYPSLYLYYSFPGILLFFYLFSPVRIWENPILFYQLECLLFVSVMAAACLLLVLFSPFSDFSFQFTRTDLLVGTYFLYHLFIFFLHPVSREALYKVFALFILYIYFRQLPVEKLIRLLYIVPFCCLWQIIEGILAFDRPWQTLADIKGIFINSGIFGGFVAFSLIGCLSILLFHGSSRFYINKILSALFIFPLLIQLIYTNSRAAWLAVFCAGVYAGWVFINKKLNIHRIVKIVGISLFFLISCYMIHGLYHYKKDSADGRLLIWAISIDMVKEKPGIGKGPGAFRREYMEKQGLYFSAHPDSEYKMLAGENEYAFNEYLRLIIEKGLVGLGFFACIIWSVFYNKGKAREKNVFTSLLCVLLVFGFFSYPFSYLHFQVLLVFSLAGAGKNGKAYSFPPLPGKYLKLAGVGVASLFLVSTIHYGKNVMAWSNVLKNEEQDTAFSVHTLERIESLFQQNSLFYYSYGKYLIRHGYYKEAIRIFGKSYALQPLCDTLIEMGRAYQFTGEHTKAITCWEKASRMIPSKFMPLYLTAKLYYKSGEYEKANEYTELILEKEIKVESFRLDRMLEEIRNIQDSIAIKTQVL